MDDALERGIPMKAAVQYEYGDPEVVVAVEDVPDPAVGDGEVLVRVRAAGVNWADRSMTVGVPLVMRFGYGLRGPRRRVRGTDVAGTVERIGRNVHDLTPGDDVYGWGVSTFAEYAVIPAGQLVSKPASITFEQAGGIAMAGCVALQAWRDVAEIGAGDRVLVVGASGGIGTFAVQIGRAMGAHVTGVCSTPNLELVRSLGADRVIDYTVEDFTSGGERYDAILDMADTHTLDARRGALAANGTLIPNSGEGGRWFGSVGRILRARAISPFVGQRLRPFLSLAKRDDLLELNRMIEEGELAPVVGSTYALADTGAAIRHAGSGHARGKVVVTP